MSNRKVSNESIDQFINLCLLSIFLTACGSGGSSAGSGASSNSEDSGNGEPLDVVIDPDALMSVPSKEPELIRADADDSSRAQFKQINLDYAGVLETNGIGYQWFIKSAWFDADEDLSHVLFHVSSDEGMNFEVNCPSQHINKENRSSMEFIIIEHIAAGDTCNITIKLYGDNDTKDKHPYRLVVTELNRETLGMTADEHLVQIDMQALPRPCSLWEYACYHRLERSKEVKAGEIIRQVDSPEAERPWDDQLFVNFKQGYLKAADGIKLPFIEVNSSRESFIAEKREQYQKDDEEGWAANEEKTTYNLFVKSNTVEIEGTFSYLLKIDSIDYRGTPNDTSDDHSLELLYQAEVLPVGAKVLF